MAPPLIDNDTISANPLLLPSRKPSNPAPENTDQQNTKPKNSNHVPEQRRRRRVVERWRGFAEFRQRKKQGRGMGGLCLGGGRGYENGQEG